MLICIPARSNDFCTDVFNRLVNSAGNSYQPKPTLTIDVINEELIAETSNTGEIKVGFKLIELCRRFGPDSCNALAYILAHEMAHYYQNHGWLANFKSAYANVEWSRKLDVKEKKLVEVYETQADEMGFFYSLNAGYQSWKISTQVIDSVYKWFQLPDQLEGYPPLAQRKQIATSAKDKVCSLMPLFRIANNLILMGKYFPGETQYVFYQTAAYCYDHLIHENVKTPGILNNLGVIYFLQAQPYFYESVNKLMYPLIIDESTSAIDMAEVVGSKGVTSPNLVLAPEAIELLEKAKSLFNEVLKDNRDYLPAVNNISLVHFILNEEGSLSDRIKQMQKLVKTNSAFGPNCYQLSALAYYLKGDKKKMTDYFKKAMKLDDNTAILNNDFLNKSTSHLNESMTPLQWPVDTFEKIFGLRVNEFFKKYRPAQQEKGRVDHYNDKIFTLWVEAMEDGNIYTFRSSFSQIIYRDLYFYEIVSGTARTSRGLKLGMTSNDLTGIYGSPYFKNVSASAEQYLYPSQFMIVTVNQNSQLVTGITYYGSIK